MSEFGRMVADRTVMFERVLPGPIEKVWEFLIDGEKRGTWLARGEMERRAGGKFEFFFKHSELSDVAETVPERFKKMEKGVGFNGAVLAYEPPHLLRISWWEKGSEVSFRLTPQGEDVLLTLVHEKLPSRDDMLGVSRGWHTHLGVLEDRLNSRDPAGFWARFEALGNAYEAHIPME